MVVLNEELLRASVSIKRQENEAVSRNIHSACIFPQCFSFLTYGKFNENPNMRAVASTHLIFASNSSEGQIFRALLNWMGPFDTPTFGAKLCRTNLAFFIIIILLTFLTK